MAKSAGSNMFDGDASLDELAGIGRNSRFDEAIDNEENEQIEVVCRRPNPNPTGDHDKHIEIPLAKPSRAFYFGDRHIYEQEAKRFTQAEKHRILNVDTFKDNEKVFDELKRACQRGFVVPFVGAGMSRSAGLPDWKGYLLHKCEAAGLSVVAMKERLEKKGDYEGVMNDIVSKLGTSVFERDFERDFHAPADISGGNLLAAVV
jgi:curved DNA-binding protein CbpA